MRTVFKTLINKVRMSCLFKSLDGKSCDKARATAFGFCARHAKTVQGTKAKAIFLKTPVETPKVETPKVETPKVEPPKEETLKKEKKHGKKSKKHKSDSESSEEFDDASRSGKRKVLEIKKNRYGRFMDPDTRIVFDSHLKMATAVQGKGGKLQPLELNHIKHCIKQGWSYLGEED